MVKKDERSFSSSQKYEKCHESNILIYFWPGRCKNVRKQYFALGYGPRKDENPSHGSKLSRIRIFEQVMGSEEIRILK